MQFYGDINLQNNELQNLAIGIENDFPIEPIVGRLVFKNQTLYICADLDNVLPIWVPITNKISMYKEDIIVASATLTITHNLTTQTPIVQIYDENDSLIIPNSVIPSTDSELVITLGAAITGKVVVLNGEEMPTNGVTVLQQDTYSYTIDMIAQSVMVIRHNLGYYPITRAFINDSEVLPSNIIHDSVFQTTVTFSSPQTATIRFI